MAAEKEGPMRQNSKLILAVLLLVYAGFAATRGEVSAGSHFEPPDITAAGEIPYPVDSIASGLVSLAVNLSAGGRVENVQVARGISSLTAVAISAVSTWSFSPGKLDGVAVPSTINIQVMLALISVAITPEIRAESATFAIWPLRPGASCDRTPI